MSIVSRVIDGDAEERESALVAFVAERALRHGPMPTAFKTIARLGLEMGLKTVDASRIVQKGEALADSVRGTDIEKAIRKGDVAAATAMLARIAEAPTPDSVPERLAPHPQKMGFREEVAESFSIVAKFLSPLFGFLVLIVLCLPYMLFEWLLRVRHGFSFAAFGLTVAFWLLLAVCLSVMPWKKLRPNREWLFAPIRFLRQKFRRLEAATRPE